MTIWEEIIWDENPPGEIVPEPLSDLTSAVAIMTAPLDESIAEPEPVRRALENYQADAFQGVRLYSGDCVEVMATMADHSIDSIVCDPPYEIAFMGRAWDNAGVAFDPNTWLAAFRVLKPGGHLLAFGGTRTYHRMVCAIEDAGFEIRDSLHWIYGSGFPKSMNVGKAIDRSNGTERDVVSSYERSSRSGGILGTPGTITRNITTPSVDAEQWEGWGTALKPAHEPIVVARKPLVGTVARNVLEHGTGALNIDASRVGTADDLNGGAYSGELRQRDEYTSNDTADGAVPMSRLNRGAGEFRQPAGRWPSNVVLSHSDGCVQVGERTVAGHPGYPNGPGGNSLSVGREADGSRVEPHEAIPDAIVPAYECDPGCPVAELDWQSGFGDTGGASRFFNQFDPDLSVPFKYQAKPSGAERSAGMTTRSTHPTVKPVDLMRWLVRLVTPPGGTVLDPFLGSGTTGMAAVIEGFEFVGIEKDTEHGYMDIASARIRWAQEAVDAGHSGDAWRKHLKAKKPPPKE